METVPRVGIEPTAHGFSVRSASWFWSHVDSLEHSPGGCWPWMGRFCGSGYGEFRDGPSTRRLAHRTALELSTGPIPRGKVVRHRCHNRACCNPAHLLFGSVKDNFHDAISADRHCRGERSPNAKLTDHTARAIRRRRAAGALLRVLSEEYGVCTAVVHAVANGRAWRHRLPEVLP